MSKKRIKIPLAIHWMTEKEWKSQSAKPLPKGNSGFVALQDAHRKVPLLVAFTDSPQRVLLVPELEGKCRKKVKSCCDKRCSGCQIPLRSSATIGYFVEKRIRKSLKKDKWCRAFFSNNMEAALETLFIQHYAPAPETKTERKLHQVLAIS